MKKFLSYALVAVMLVAAVAVSASALTWSTGEGLWVHEGANYGSAEATKASPVVVTNNDDGSITVEQGGYWKAPYTNGGVFTKELVGLDGLSVELYFEKAPIATNDCSPPERSDIFLITLPGGATLISIPLSNTFCGSESLISARPPPKS